MGGFRTPPPNGVVQHSARPKAVQDNFQGFRPIGGGGLGGQVCPPPWGRVVGGWVFERNMGVDAVDVAFGLYSGLFAHIFSFSWTLA